MTGRIIYSEKNDIINLPVNVNNFEMSNQAKLVAGLAPGAAYLKRASPPSPSPPTAWNQTRMSAAISTERETDLNLPRSFNFEPSVRMTGV